SSSEPLRRVNCFVRFPEPKTTSPNGTRTADNRVNRPAALPSLSLATASTVLSRSPLGRARACQSFRCPLQSTTPASRLELSQMHWLAAPLGPRQDQERFLNSGSQEHARG